MLTIAGGVVLAALVLFVAYALVQAEMIAAAFVTVGVFLIIAAFPGPLWEFGQVIVLAIVARFVQQ